MNITLKLAVEIETSCCTYNDGPVRWSAYFSQPPCLRGISHSQTSYSTPKKAKNALIKRARDYGYQLTIHRSKD